MEKAKASIELKKQVNEVLLNGWDPIGIKDTPEAKLEYDSYALTVAGKLLNNATEEQLVEFLNNVVVKEFELPEDKAKATVVARKLLALVR